MSAVEKATLAEEDAAVRDDGAGVGKDAGLCESTRFI